MVKYTIYKSYDINYADVRYSICFPLGFQLRAFSFYRRRSKFRNVMFIRKMYRRHVNLLGVEATERLLAVVKVLKDHELTPGFFEESENGLQKAEVITP